ncbi:hypothetical protein E2C01_046631 [Portunus trituberculatus]|uniref:Uncharacterized protein n=1 Tax=Portunus trituberculatus TaxID=210409 RepID=A0A5B7G5L4_PORTR|nr:hypothetical protein [Portunus trituberculatus]
MIPPSGAMRPSFPARLRERQHSLGLCLLGLCVIKSPTIHCLSHSRPPPLCLPVHQDQQERYFTFTSYTSHNPSLCLSNLPMHAPPFVPSRSTPSTPATHALHTAEL